MQRSSVVGLMQRDGVSRCFPGSFLLRCRMRKPKPRQQWTVVGGSSRLRSCDSRREGDRAPSALRRLGGSPNLAGRDRPALPELPSRASPWEGRHRTARATAGASDDHCVLLPGRNPDQAFRALPGPREPLPFETRIRLSSQEGRRARGQPAVASAVRVPWRPGALVRDTAGLQTRNSGLALHARQQRHRPPHVQGLRGRCFRTLPQGMTRLGERAAMPPEQVVHATKSEVCDLHHKGGLRSAAEGARLRQRPLARASCPASAGR